MLQLIQVNILMKELYKWLY